MKKNRPTLKQIIRLLRDADSGLRNGETCLRNGQFQRNLSFNSS